MDLINKIRNIRQEEFFKQNLIVFFAVNSYNAINYLFQLAMGRLLGPSDYSIFIVLFSIIYILVAPIMAIQTLITKQVAEFKANLEFKKIRDLFIRSNKKLTYFSLALIVIFTIFSKQISAFLKIDSTSPITILNTIIFAVVIAALNRGFLQGNQKFNMLSFSYIVEGLIKLTLSIGLVLLGFKVIGALVGVSLSIYLAIFLIIIFLLKTTKTKEREKIDSKQIFKRSIPIILAMSLIAIIYSIDVILVKHYFSPIESGYYGAASLLGKIIFFASMSLSMVMFPKVAELYSKKDIAYKKFFTKSLLLSLVIIIPSILVYFFAPNFVINMLFGSEYQSATSLVKIFGFAMAAFSLSYIFINYQLSKNKHFFIYPLTLMTILETILIVLFHESLMQVVYSLTAITTSLLIFLVIYELKQNENFLNNSGV